MAIWHESPSDMGSAAFEEMTMTALRDAAMKSKAWPFEEARAVLKRFEKKAPEKGYVLFETGYGPSGLPHIGTFQEVLRTTLVRRAFEVLTGAKTRLIAFSDDMDGLRKVPDNLPRQELIAANLGKPLTSVPAPSCTSSRPAVTCERRSWIDWAKSGEIATLGRKLICSRFATP